LMSGDTVLNAYFIKSEELDFCRKMVYNAYWLVMTNQKA
jgi:hypothetical protein